MKKITFVSAGVIIVLGLAAVVALGGAFGGPFRAQAAPLAATITVTSLADTGPGTLRQALLGVGPGDTINFGVDGIIALDSRLPTIITNNLTIDATSRNVIISGTNAGPDANGLVILNAQSVTIRGLQIVNFTGTADFTGHAIWITGTDATSNTVAGCYLGTDRDSTAGLGNRVGLVIEAGASRNTVGGSTAADRNIVSGNMIGVVIAYTGTMYNEVVGNYIGTNVTGMAALPNNLWGMVLWYASENTIGAIPATQSNVAARQMTAGGNLVSGNNDDGIFVTHSMSNTIAGNYIGTNATGTAIVDNINSNIAIAGGSQYNVIRNNVIVGDETSCPPCSNGVVFGGENTMYNRVMYNRIGIGPNDQPMPNWDGVGLDPWGEPIGPQKNTIGPGNIIAFNVSNGIWMSGTHVLSNTITQNSIYSNTVGKGISQDSGANRAPNLIPTLVLTGDGNCEVEITTCPGCVVELFSDYGDEGRWYEATVIADASGTFTYSLGYRGPKLTATATDQAGNTSEFSYEEEGACHRAWEPIIIRNSNVISP